MSHILLSQQRLAGRSIVSTGLALLLLLMSGCTSMQQAAKTGDVQTIIKGLSAGKDVDMVDSTGRPLLAIAAERGQLEIIRELISRGADLEKKDSRGMTPLYIAAGYNQLAAVQELVVAGANIESRNTTLELTPLMPAAESGYNAVAEYLLSKGADAAARSSDGQTALSRLAMMNARTSQSNNVGTAQLLLNNVFAKKGKKPAADYINFPDATGMTPLHRAAGSNNTDILSFLLKNGANPNAVARLPLDYEQLASMPEVSAFSQPTPEPGLFVALLSKRQSVFGQAEQPLSLSETTMPEPSPPSAYISNWTPLLSVVQHCQQADEGVAVLLANGANPVTRASNGRTVLQILAECEKGDTGVVAKRILDKARTKVSASEFRKFVNDTDDTTGRSPLLSAVIHNQPETTRLLLAAGASPNEKSKDGYAPLHVALQAGSHDVARYLLAAGANPDQPNHMGLNPLYWMVDKGDIEAVRVLLNAGAKPNIAGEGGWMPLHRAIGAGAVATTADTTKATPNQAVAIPQTDAEMIKLLLSKGANPDAMLSTGVAPLHMALDRDDLDTARLLLAGGAKVNLKKADDSAPLYSAISSNKVDTVKLLLDHGATPNGDASLYLAVQRNSLPIIKLLLDAKANPNQAFKSWTPLHKAAADGHDEAYRMLLQAGASAALRNSDGDTPYDLALKRRERIAAAEEAARRDEERREQASARNAQMFVSGMAAIAGAYTQAMDEQTTRQIAQRQQIASFQAQAEAQRSRQLAAEEAEAAERQQRKASNNQTLATPLTGSNQTTARRDSSTQAQQEAEAIRRATVERQQREAQQRAEEKKRQAEQAEQERKQKIAAREAEKQRAEEERRISQEHRKQEEVLAKKKYLDDVRRGVRLLATQCNGKNKPYSVGGIKPRVKLPEIIKHHAGCVAVRYEARCPGTPEGAGVKGVINYYVGSGSSCVGYEGTLSRVMPCPAKEVQVDVDDVISCL